MTKIVFAAVVVCALAACAQSAPQPPTAVDNAANALTSGFEPYCGPIWSVDKQGYVTIPCPSGSGYVSNVPR